MPLNQVLAQLQGVFIGRRETIAHKIQKRRRDEIVSADGKNFGMPIERKIDPSSSNTASRSFTKPSPRRP